MYCGLTTIGYYSIIYMLMPVLETSRISELYKHQVIDRDRDTSLLNPPADYQGPAFLRSETCLIPIRIIGNLGKVDEGNTHGKERQKFAAVLDSPDINMRKRIQGGVWAERVGVKPSVLERFVLDGAITDDEKKCDETSFNASESRETESSLSNIPEGYHGPAVLLVDGTSVPIYVGGIGEETGKGHARARLDLGKEGQIRLEGEIEASRVKAKPSAIIVFENVQKKWDYRNW